MDGTDVHIKNENHTLGYLLQSSIYRSPENQKNDPDSELFVGYINPHPLENVIILRINNSDINEIKKIISNGIKYINSCLDNTSESIDGPKPKKKKLKFVVKSKKDKEENEEEKD